MKKQKNSVTDVRSASRKMQSSKQSSGSTAPSSVSDLKLKALACLLLVVATAVAYSQVFGCKFIDCVDDPDYVTSNPFITQGFGADSIKWAFTTFRCGNWHPLTWLSHIADYRMHGLDPTGHHFTSLLFHIANTVMLFLVLNRMTGSNWRSGFVAGLFALHPLHVETVAWVAERKDVLSTFFWIATIYAYVTYIRRPGIGRYMLVVAAFGLGLLSKPMLVSLPLVLLLLDYWPLNRGSLKWRLLWEKAPLLMMSAASCVVTIFAQKAGGAVVHLSKLPIDIRLENAAVSYIRYLAKAMWPSKLAFFYPHPLHSLPGWQILLSVVILAVVTYLVLRQRQRRPYLAVGWLWYLITLVPVIGIVQVGGQSMADRYSYMTLTGILIMVAWGVTGLVRRRAPYMLPMLKPAAIGVLAVLAVCTYTQTSVWTDSLSLSDHAIKVTENNFVAYDRRGVTLYDMGRREGIHDLARALEMAPDFASAHLDYGNRLIAEGEPRRGVEHILTAIRLGLNSAGAHDDLAYGYYVLGQSDLAVQACRTALRLDPRCSQARNLLGIIAAKQGQLDKAIAHWHKTSMLDPDFRDVHENLATVYAYKGQYAAAWREIYRFVARGGKPARDFLAALSARMPDPGPH